MWVSFSAAHGHCPAELSCRHRRAAARAPLPRDLRARLRGARILYAARSTAEHRRGVPRRHRLAATSRLAASDRRGHPEADRRAGRHYRIGRCRAEHVPRQARLGHEQARRSDRDRPPADRTDARGSADRPDVGCRPRNGAETSRRGHHDLPRSPALSGRGTRGGARYPRRTDGRTVTRRGRSRRRPRQQRQEHQPGADLCERCPGR